MRLVPRIFYGWWVLAAGSSIMALVGAINVYGISLFMVPLTTEFGWTRSALSGAISLARLEGGMLGPAEGFLVDRFGPRRIMLLGIPLMGIGFVALGFLDSLAGATGLDTIVWFYLCYILLISLGGSLGTFTPASTAVANWFIRRRGVALGILSAGLGVGAAVGAPVLGQAIEALGWRQAAIGAGVMTVLVGVPAALLMRHRPEQYGLQPDGGPAPGPSSGAAGATGDRSTPPAGEQEFTVRQALRTWAFWIMAVAFAVRVSITGAVALHLAPLLQDMGMSTVEAAGVLSALAALSILGRLGIGWLGDVLDKRLIYMGGLAAMTVSLVVLAFAAQFWHIVVFLAFYSPAYGGLAALMTALRADYFGRRAFATIGGLMGPVTTLGTISGPLFAAYVFDTSGSYRLAMLVFATAAALALVLVFFLKRPSLAADANGRTQPPAGAELEELPAR